MCLPSFKYVALSISEIKQINTRNKKNGSTYLVARTIYTIEKFNVFTISQVTARKVLGLLTRSPQLIARKMLSNQKSTANGKEVVEPTNQKYTANGKEGVGPTNQKSSASSKKGVGPTNQKSIPKGKEGVEPTKRKSTTNCKEDVGPTDQKSTANETAGSHIF